MNLISMDFTRRWICDVKMHVRQRIMADIH